MGNIFFSDLEICFGKMIEISQSRLEFRDIRNKILDLVSRLKIQWKNLVLVSRNETERRQFSISSRNSKYRLLASDCVVAVVFVVVVHYCQLHQEQTCRRVSLQQWDGVYNMGQ